MFGVNFTFAVSEPNPMAIIPEMGNHFFQIRNILACLPRSCDPTAISTAFEIEDWTETELKRVPSGPETEFDKFRTLYSIASEKVPILRSVDPNCSDPDYTCPNCPTDEVPSEYAEYITDLSSVLDASSCITQGNSREAMYIFANFVNCVRSNKETTGTSFARLAPCIAAAGNSLRDLCTKTYVPEIVICPPADQ